MLSDTLVAANTDMRLYVTYNIRFSHIKPVRFVQCPITLMIECCIYYYRFLSSVKRELIAVVRNVCAVDVQGDMRNPLC